MADPRTQPGGLRPPGTSEQVTKTMLTDMQTMGLSAVFNLLAARLLRDDGGDTYESGFFGSDCLCAKGSGSLDVDVAAGVGFYYDTAESDPHELIYKPIVVRADFTQALSAHDPADPRYDIICLAPARDDDESETVYVYGGGTSSLNTRRRFGYSVQVVEGTPASSPSVPATPSGHIKIAECLVPAASGDVTVTDTRTVLQLTRDLAGPPGSDYHQPWVPGTGTELEVTAATYPNVSVAAGEAHINGRKYEYDADTEAMTTTDGDYYIFAKADGSFGHALKSDYTDRADAEDTEEAAVIAEATVNTAGTSVTVTDLRRRQPYDGGAHIEDGTVGGTKLAFNLIKPDLTDGSEISDTIPIDLVTQNMDGDAVGTGGIDGFRYVVEVYNSSLQLSSLFAITETGSGSLIDGGSSGRAIIETNADGEAQVSIEDTSTSYTGSAFVSFAPINVPGVRKILEITFA